MGWQDAPVVGGQSSGSGGWQSAPAVSEAKTAQPSDLDYSQSPWSALGRTFESSADWGTGDLLRAAMTGKKPSETAAQSSAAAASLPWYVRYPTEAAGYGLGLVNLLDPVTDLAEGGAAALGAGSTLSKIAGTAAEGATVGGVSHIAGSDDPGALDTAGAALGGAALGGLSGAAAPLVNKGLTKAFGKAGTIDPEDAIRQTAQRSSQIYAQGTQYPIRPMNVHDPIAAATENLSSSQRTGMSDTFQNQVKNIQKEIVDQHNQGNMVNANDVDSWQRQINNAASTSIDGGVANDISKSLDQVLQTHGASQWQQDAKTAFQQKMMAENLGEWQRAIQAGGNLGQKPLTEAERYYDPSSPEYSTLAGLANQGGAYDQHGVGWWLPHLAGHVLGMGGYAVAGLPGSIAGEVAGLMLKKPIKSALKGYNQRSQLRDIQAAYPQMTGQPLVGATTGPQLPQGAGDMIKNLMLGGVY